MALALILRRCMILPVLPAGPPCLNAWAVWFNGPESSQVPKKRKGRTLSSWTGIKRPPMSHRRPFAGENRQDAIPTLLPRIIVHRVKLCKSRTRRGRPTAGDPRTGSRRVRYANARPGEAAIIAPPGSRSAIWIGPIIRAGESTSSLTSEAWPGRKARLCFARQAHRSERGRVAGNVIPPRQGP